MSMCAVYVCMRNADGTLIWAEDPVIKATLLVNLRQWATEDFTHLPVVAEVHFDDGDDDELCVSIPRQGKHDLRAWPKLDKSARLYIAYEVAKLCDLPIAELSYMNTSNDGGTTVWHIGAFTHGPFPANRKPWLKVTADAFFEEMPQRMSGVFLGDPNAKPATAEDLARSGTCPLCRYDSWDGLCLRCGHQDGEKA